MTFQSLPILVPTLIDPLNSSSISLGSNAIFTGTFTNLIAFPVVDVIIITDQPGTLFLDVSSDGVTVSQTTSFAVTSTLLFRSPFSWQYIRLRYTNGAIAQTTFFLQCILRPSDPGLASLPLNRTISNNSIAPLNRAVLNAQAPSGFYQNLQCDASNILLVDVSNFPSIQPVSGTVTANIGTTGSLALDSSLTTIDTDIKASQPRKLQDGSGNAVTSQINGIQRALDVGIDVAGVQIDPRSQGIAAASTAGWPITGGIIAESTAAWTSSTVLNTAVTVTVTGYNSVLVTLNQGSTITGGVVTFELSDTAAFTNAYLVNAVEINSPSTVSTTYTLIASTNQAFYINVRGAAAFRIRLSNVITGTGTVNVGVQANAMEGDPVMGASIASWLGSTSPTVGQKTSANSIPVVLPSDQTVNVSIAQSTDLDNGRVFYASVDSYNLATAGSANNPIFLMKNPVGSGKTMYIFSIIGNCKIANVQVTFYLYANPTITLNGTPFTPVNAKIGSGITSGMQIFTASTIATLGTLVTLDQVGQNSNSEQMVITQEIEIAAGQTVLITGNPFSNNRTIITAVGWVEK